MSFIPLILLVCGLGCGPAVNAANAPAGAARRDREGLDLVAERRLDSPPQLEWVAVEIDKVKLVVGSGGCEERARSVHGIDTLGQLEGSNRLRLAHVPVAHRLVPRARGDDGRVGGGDFDEAYCADGRRMGLDRHGLAGAEVHDMDLLVRSGADGDTAVLRKGLVLDTRECRTTKSERELAYWNRSYLCVQG